jgi:hypothetical protein
MATSVGARRSNVRNQSSRNIYHLCFNSGTFTPNFSGTVSYLIVAGGGGGGMDMGGGGGGGAVYEGTATVTAGTSYPIVVGAAGQGAPAGGLPANPNFHQFTQSATQGGASSAFGNTCYGGGYGGSSYWNYTPNNGYGQGGGNVGSGGGTSGYGVTDGTTRAGGAAGTGGVGSRNAGGLGRRQSGYFSGGGGGAGSAGQQGISTARPFGGDGIGTTIVEGFILYFGAGGGGAGYTADGGQGGSGIGGGGALDSECSSLNGIIGSANKSGWSNSYAFGLGAEGVSALVGTFGETGGFGRNSTWGGGRGGNAARWSGAGGGGGGHYNRGNNGGDGGSGIVIIKHLRSLGDSSFNPTNSNNISARNNSKFDLNNDIIFNMDAQHEYPYALDHVLLVAGGGAGGMDMGGGGGAGGVVSYINYPVPYYENGFEEIYIETSIGAGGTGSGTYGSNPPPGGNGGDSTFHIKVRDVSTNSYTHHLSNKIVAKGGGGGGSGHYTAAYGDGRGVHGGSAGGDSPKWGGYIKQTEGTLGTPGQGSAGGAAGYNGNGSYESGGGGGSYSAGMPGAAADSQQLCGDGGRGITMPNQFEWGGLSQDFTVAGGGGGGGYDTHGGDGYDGGGGGSSWSQTAGAALSSNTTYAAATSGISGNSSTGASTGGAATTATQGGNAGANSGGGGGGGNHQALGGNGGSGLCVIACNYPNNYIFGGTGMAFKRSQNNRNQIHSQSSGDIRFGNYSSLVSFHPRDIAGNLTCDGQQGSGAVNGYIDMSPVATMNYGGNNNTGASGQLYPHHTTGDADIKYWMDTYSDPNGPNNVPDPSQASLQGSFFSGQTLGGVNQFDSHRLGPKKETAISAKGWKLNGSTPRLRFMKHQHNNVGSPHTSDGVLYGLRERGSYEFWVRPTSGGVFTLAHFGGSSTENLHMYMNNSAGDYSLLYLAKLGGTSSGNSLGSTTYRVVMDGNVQNSTYARFSGRLNYSSTAKWHHIVYTFDYERNYTRPSIQPTNGDPQRPSYYTGGWDIYWDGVCMTDPSISALGQFYTFSSGSDLSSAGVIVSNSTNASFWTGLPLATDFADQYVNIGNYNNSYIGNGYISCARIYKRCLERDEVKQLYLSQAPLFVKKESYDDPNSTRIAKEGHINNLW